MHVEDGEAKSVGEVSEACHNEHIRQEFSVPSAESSYGVRRVLAERRVAYRWAWAMEPRQHLLAKSHKRYEIKRRM